MTDLKNKSILIGILVISLFLISFTSAEVTVTPSSTILLNSYHPSQQLTFNNLNHSQDVELQFFLSSQIKDIVQLSKSTLNIGFGTPYHDSITLSIPDSYGNGGSFTGTLTYNSTYTNPIQIPISVVVGSVDNSTQNSGCSLDIFPGGKPNMKIPQGETDVQSIQITVPSCLSPYVDLRGVALSTGQKPIQLGDYALGKINAGESLSIPIDLNAIDVQTGFYSDTLTFLVYDSQGNKILTPSVSLGLQVSAGVSPVTQDTFSTPPTCSLSATTFNLNNTYSFTCSGVVSNLNVEPQYSEYFEGKTVDVSSGLYKYEFVPLKYGEADFVSIFRYNGAPIFQPFKQHVRITSAGSLVAGTNLKLIFTPKLDEATGDEGFFLIQLGDNKTGSLVQGPKVWVNARELNSSTGTFEYAFEPNKDYEIRGKADGYEDILQTINIKPQKINIKISPGTGDTLTTFNINTSVENATIFIGGTNYSNAYVGLLPGGINEIKAVKEGYKTEIINFTVKDRVKIVSFGGEFKKGINQNFTLNTNSSWIVYYKKSMDATERTEIKRGNNNLVTFLPDKKGIYVIEANEVQIGTYEIPGFNLSNKWCIFHAWVWLFIFAPILLIIIIVKITKNNGNPTNQDGAGLALNVGDLR